MKKLILSIVSVFGLYVVNAQCPPTISCPGNITVGTDSNLCGAIINYNTPVGLDTCGLGADSVMYSGSIINWTVPTGVNSMTIEVRGAQGGDAPGVTGGLGAVMIGDFTVTPGQVLKVLVGQQGVAGINTSDQSGGAGGGGTYVTDASNNPLIIAGGGGGAMAYVWGGSGAVPGGPGQTTQNGQQGDGGGSAGGTGGNGGVTFPWTGWHSGTGGGGLLTDGVGTTNGSPSYGTPNGPGRAFVNGGAGGTGGSAGRNGAFGGGGAAGYTGAGGGGYSGGGSGSHQQTRTYSGGGGGSFNGGTNQSNTSGANSGNGFVKFNWGGAAQPTTQTSGLPSGAQFPVGTTVNTFVTSNGLGSDTCSFTITVIDSGQVTVLGALSQDTVCTSSGTVTLPVGTPAGGNYSGTGVTGNTFDPATAERGNHWIYYTDTVGCQNTDSVLITVVWCTGIEEGALSDIVTIAPNPSNGVFQLSIPQGEHFEKLELYDASGRKVWTAIDPGNTTALDLTNNADGLYMLHVGMNGQQQVFRLLKK